ncbi:hypothetical protein [Sporohalobacter salinus]|uniref:hypothetical protein n=1 Tax=Sporohalobacter salinus TaxID=1494606 RepID=UPI00195F791F|nr:hypothetical protein [Sporohalobacter salinus]MBM7623652.1 hypothetical protein [Sporohalobacter salinus]
MAVNNSYALKIESDDYINFENFDYSGYSGITYNLLINFDNITGSDYQYYLGQNTKYPYYRGVGIRGVFERGYPEIHAQVHKDVLTKNIDTRNYSGNHYVTLTYDFEYLKLYIDGKLFDKIKRVDATITSSMDTIMQINTIYDEISIWNRALTQEEIQNKMNKYLIPSQETGLVAYYRCDDNSDTSTLIDATENNNHGTINGATYVPGEVDLFRFYHLFENNDSIYYWDGSSMQDTELTLSTATNDEIETEATSNGVEYLSTVDLEAFSEYKILTYVDDDAVTLNGKLIGTPKSQLLLANGDIDFANINKTNSIILTATGNPVIIASPNSGANWYTYDGNWQEITSLAGLVDGANATPTQINEIESNGMSIGTFNNLNTEIDDLVAMGGQESIRFGYLLHDGDSLDNLDIQTDKEGSYELMIPGTDYTYKLSNDLLELTVNNAPIGSPNEVKINIG